MRSFERERFLALVRSRDNYEAVMSLKSSLSKEFNWWKINIVKAVNYLSFKLCVEIYSDASLSD